jgi:hypothetical protein
MARTWKHDELAHDLAQHLLTPKRLLWCDMQLGPAGSPRPDVYAIDKSFAHPRATSYEVKVSQSDFRADVTAGKWQSYLAFSSGVFFAAPAGLLSREDVPKGCGLMVRGDEGWRTMRAPTLQPFRLTADACLKLLIDGREQEVRPAARCERTAWGASEKITRRWGAAAAKVIADLDAARRRAEHWEAEAEAHRKQIGDAESKAREMANAMTAHWLDELCRLLSMPRGDFGAIAQRVSELRKIALGEKRWHRSNLEQSEELMAAELRRIRELRVVLGEVEREEVDRV